ncbi:hypothetical protein FHT00_003008 [Sphingomonas insulae]|nr:hypothetical protein [Sphingomonas insulae]
MAALRVIRRDRVGRNSGAATCSALRHAGHDRLRLQTSVIPRTDPVACQRGGVAKADDFDIDSWACRNTSMVFDRYDGNAVLFLCRASAIKRGLQSMLWTLAVILLILWLLGFVVFHVAGGLIHILIVVAVIVIVYQLVTGRRG